MDTNTRTEMTVHIRRTNTAELDNYDIDPTPFEGMDPHLLAVELPDGTTLVAVDPTQLVERRTLAAVE